MVTNNRHIKKRKQNIIKTKKEKPKEMDLKWTKVV